MYYTEKQLIEFGQMILNRVTDNPDNAKTVTDADVANFKEGQPKVKMAYVDQTEGRHQYGSFGLNLVELLGSAKILQLNALEVHNQKKEVAHAGK